MNLEDFGAKLKKSKAKSQGKIHSADHHIADQLSRMMNEPKRFGFYLKMAQTHNHGYLLKIANEILENPKVISKGKLFAYLIKKNHLVNKSTN